MAPARVSKYEFFSPEEVIRTYFREFAGSIQNKSHSKALEYAQKVEKLRAHFATFLGIEDTHLVSFQFNQYYVNRLIFKYLKIDANWIIFSDDLELKTRFSENQVYSLEKLLDHSNCNHKNKSLIWISKLKNINLELFEAVRNFKHQNKGTQCYVFLSLDYLLYSSPEISAFLREFSFLVFTPSVLFQEYGIVIFAFRKEISLIPIFMGSGAAQFNRETKKLEFKKLPHLLEIGTQNIISLIILERYFFFLSTSFEQISARLRGTALNFNLSENLLPK
ncbi:hypothetical protein [Candidatus Mycoplasma haematominutum]|uniref:Uncharacterized protein n=1 Tax=Candidatus Mycoplasma haematominutum 'Birmingham 1' TaxID=1116213 RepID=G8C395_9MOLU|nr:hypothetical protein [Candidatus Mycoplasma haematominutum]CCE66793.1 conserved haemoplasma hypothetical protein [Candidatus Mycoplasma haematominutum 'Birmingham 1']